MLEEVKQCPSCGGISFARYLKTRDFMQSHESFYLDQCQDCNLIFTNPRPTHESIAKYYSSDQYISHTNSNRSVKDIIYKTVRSYSLKTKVKLISSLTNQKTLLDYGCGTGHFLQSAHKDGWKVQGVEPNQNATDQLSSNIDSKVVNDIEKISSTDPFSIITLWHVLEHIHELNNTLSKLTRLLASDGHFVIAVPNLKSYDAAYYKEYWAAYDVPRHLYHFTRSSMKTLATKHGLKVVKILPMIFDSFYVSLLSEQYKNNSNKYIKSIITGYKSNSYAKTNGEYSSLIYTLNRA